MYLAFEHIGPGHYDCVTESTQGTEDFDNMENLKEFKTTHTRNSMKQFAKICLSMRTEGSTK